jgi:hypothetical protein
MSLNTDFMALRRAGAVVTLGLFTCAMSAWGSELRVPKDFSTIQAAINSAAPGDTIRIAKGTYKGVGNINLDCRGKALRIEGEGYLSTIIDCEGFSRGFIFNSGETSATEIRALTIQNGRSELGGAILVSNSSPAILYCSINENSASYGGAVAIQGGSPGFVGCQFVNNRGLLAGGAIYSYGSSATLSSNVFDSNDSRGVGGAIAMESGSLFIVSNKFTDNVGDEGGGAFHSLGGNVAFVNGSFSVNTAATGGGAINLTDGTVASFANCTFGANLSRNGPGAIKAHGSSTALVTNSIMWTNGSKEYEGTVNFRFSCVSGGASGDGNTSDDPRLTDAIKHDLHIRIGSSCIDKADKNAVVIGQDQDGRSRTIGSGPDIGAYEYPIVRPTAEVDAETDNVFDVPHDGNPDTNTVMATVHGSAYDWLQGALSYLWTSDDKVLAATPTLVINLSPGEQVFNFQARDVTNGIANQKVHVKVNSEVNTGPVANAGYDQTVLCTGATVQVTLRGNGYDPDGDQLAYMWSNGVTTQDNVLNLAPGNYSYMLMVTDPYGVSATASVKVRVVDGAPPAIILNGGDYIQHEVFTPWLDPGASAEDAIDGVRLAITVTGSVNVNILGTYILTYSARDSSGNTGTIARTVRVADTTPPVITLNGSSTMQLECGQGYVEPGTSAIDNYDGTVSVTITGTVASSPGTYVLTYTSVDTSGNVSTRTRTIIVVDSSAPVITLNGDNPMTVDCKVGYREPGASALDACGGAVPVTITGTVPSIKGTYYITYTATDASGNTATVIRTVYVVSKTPPNANAFNSTPTNIQANNKFRDIKLHYGFHAHCAPFTWTVVCTANQTVAPGDIVKVDDNNFTVKGVAGRIYTFTLIVTDADGNTASFTSLLPCNG